jgi:hypothetical protein
MCAEEKSTPVMSTSLIRRSIIYGTLLIVAFLFGFVPTWFKSRECSRNLSQAERQLSLASMQNSLASAAIDAQQGDYESARQAASAFFTSLRAEMDIVDDSSLSPAQREALQPLLAQRDGIITLLARGDLASAGQLSGLYLEFRETMQR